MEIDSIIAPDGYVWLQMAYEELLNLMSEKYVHGDNESAPPDGWALNCIEETEKRLQILFLGRQLKVVYHEDSGLKEVPYSLWRKRDYRSWIRRGEILFADGRREDVFVDMIEFRKLKAIWIEELGLVRSYDTQEIIDSKSKYVPPFIAMMLEAVEKFDIPHKTPKKHELIDYFLAQTLPNGSSISKNHAKVMATFCRPVEAMKGGNKRIHL